MALDWDNIEFTSDSEIINVDASDRMILFSGEKGDHGSAGTVTIGQTTTLPAGSNATVTNTGTSEDAILNFGIPKGEDGASEWGDIGGNLSDQTDLAEALAEKADVDSVYTKDDVDDALADKADSADVYTKTETDEALLDKAPVILSSASGSIASFSDGSPAPVTALSVNIEPVQDLHGFDYPFPPDGHPNDYTGQYTLASNLYLIPDNNHKVNEQTLDPQRSIIMPCSSGTQYRVRSGISGTMRVGSFTTSPVKNSVPNVFETATDNSDPVQLLITTGANDKYLFIQFFIDTDVTARGATFEGAIGGFYYAPYSNICPISGHTACNIYLEDEYDAEATPKVTIDLGEERYGGFIDVLAGTMVVTNQIVDLATLTWIAPETWNGWRTSDLQIVSGITDPSNFIAEKYKSELYDTITPNTYTGYGLAIGSTAKPKRIYTSNPDGIKPTGNLVFPLPTSLTVTLSPSQISTLLGQNNIWADCGPSTVDYPCDTKLYIQKINTPTDDDMIADANIASGKYFIVNNNLYLSTAAILAGDPIKPGTNCTLTNLAAALNALNS